jgi:trehalose/maltose hydrolase-like predicted phosphorylase
MSHPTRRTESSFLSEDRTRLVRRSWHGPAPERCVGIVHGFAGMTEHGDCLEFAPRLPKVWDSLTFRLKSHGSTLRVDLDHDGCMLTVTDGAAVPIGLGEDRLVVTADQPLHIPTS